MFTELDRTRPVFLRNFTPRATHPPLHPWGCKMGGIFLPVHDSIRLLVAMNVAGGIDLPMEGIFMPGRSAGDVWT
ncbi:MAG: hypothetical protein ACOCUL_04655 [Bacteroidota bacterium]